MPIPGYLVRNKIKPGLRGLAQVNCNRGDDNLKAMRKRVEFDMDYLKHWSLALDLWFIWRTAMVV
jgi:putative colanic acid biosynthesis UDP-glucose lipid carrier transferase